LTRSGITSRRACVEHRATAKRLAQVPFDVSDPVWVDDQRFEIGRHGHHSEALEIVEAADAVMSTPLDRERPLWGMWVADGLRDGRVGVVDKAHHAMIDGLAAVEMASLVLDPTREPPRPEDDRWRPAPPPDPARLLAQALADRPKLRLAMLVPRRH
jgi:diacylglycerol O-acyltransferase